MLFGPKNNWVESICIDSRSIYSSQNAVFFAINTLHNDGHKYIENAIEKGIKVVVCERETHFVEGVSYLVVENSVEALQKWAQHHFREFTTLNSIGIVGSNGKTIVKEWLYQCLWTEKNVVKSPKSFNSQIGLALSLLLIDEHHDLGIFEVGISEPKEMKNSQKVFQPKIGIFTHIGTAHSENFENIQHIIHEKLDLFEDSEFLIYNGDSEALVEEIKQRFSHKRQLRYGLKDENDLVLIPHKDSKKVDIRYFNETFEIEIEKQSEAVFHNVLAVIAVLKEFGIENTEIVQKINDLRSVEMRMESIVGIQNNTIINDSYNLDLDSLTIALEHIKTSSEKQKSLVLSDILSVKMEDDSLYLKVAKMVNLLGFQYVFLIGNHITKYIDYFYGNVYVFESTEEFLESSKIKELNHQLLLLKGARKFEFEKIQKKLEMQSHDSILQVNLDALIHNINVHKSLLKESTKIMAMVKAYSYGLGDYEIAEALQNQQVDYLGVAYADEGVVLRKKGILLPIMVMNPDRNSFGQIIDYLLEPEIYSIRTLKLLLNQLQAKNITSDFSIHIKLDTGMSRLGFQQEDFEELCQIINDNKFKVMSLFSHLSSSDREDEKEFTLQQIRLFEENANFISKKIGYKPLYHILNSSGISNYTEFQMDMVRIGIGMLGISSSPKIQKKLLPVVAFKTIISQIKRLKKGQNIGYNRYYTCPEDCNIATIPVGYADGIPRLLGNKKSYFYIKNKAYPIVGNICMDMLMLDLGQDTANEGDEVVIFEGIKQLICYAEYSQTIVYEALSSISKRVKRIYIYD